MVMLDEAGLSKQSLNFGAVNNTGSALNANSSIAAPALHNSSMGDNSSLGTTPLRGQISQENVCQKEE